MTSNEDIYRAYVRPLWEDLRRQFNTQQPAMITPPTLGRGWYDTHQSVRPYHTRSKDSMTRARTNNAFTETAPELRPVPASLAEVTSGEQAQAWFEDKVVRAVREARYCNEALRIMDAAFGKPLDTVGVYDINGHYGDGYGSASAQRLYPAYLDSDGVDCWGNKWRDKDAYDRNGLNLRGRDKDGFDKDGLDEAGFNREGKDANGVSRDDPARFQYDAAGFDKEGYNRSGYDRFGFNREGRTATGAQRGTDKFVFDTNGYDVDGYNRDGYDRAGRLNSAAAEKYRRQRRAML